MASASLTAADAAGGAAGGANDGMAKYAGLLSAAAGGVSAGSSLAQGYGAGAINDYNAGTAIANAEMRSQVDTYNAAVEARQAQIARDTAASQGEIQDVITRRTMAQTIANAGASGIDVTQGSPLQVLSDQAGQGALMKRLLLYRGEMTAEAAESRGALDQLLAQQALTSGNMQSTLDRLQGDQARMAGTMKAGSTLLTTGANLLRSNYQPSSPAGGTMPQLSSATLSTLSGMPSDI